MLHVCKNSILRLVRVTNPNTFSKETHFIVISSSRLPSPTKCDGATSM